jgi:hypothetical protein
MPDRIMTTLMAFFDQEDWSYVQVADRPILKLGFTGKNGNWTCYAQVRELDEQFVFYSICPLNVPERKRPAVMEFLTRANYGLVIGNFEMDLDDGEIRYKASLDAESCELSLGMVKNAVYANVLMMDKYLPGILSILGGNVPPAEAIDEIEAEDRRDLSRS